MNDTILAILVKHQLTPTPQLVEVMREVFLAGVATAKGAQDASTADDEEKESPLTAADLAVLRNMGVDPAKKFRLNTRVFTIVAYKPSRWKYPITAQTQNGTRYKFTADQVKRYQAMS